MTLVLRLTRQPRWDSPGKYDWLADGDIPADPLGDFANTSENSLSVWFVADDKKDLNDIVAALAATRDKPDKLDYVLFPHDHLAAVGIQARTTGGGTPDAHINASHRDLTHLSAAKVLGLTTRVWHENRELRRVNEKAVVQLVADAVRGGRIPLERLRPKLRDAVRSCFEHRGDKPGKPE